MGWEQWCEPAPRCAGPILAQEGYWGLLASVEETVLGRQLGALGIRDGVPIIVYADGPRSRGREGRIAWMLTYFGAAEVALLDGGWSMWVGAGGAVETETVTPTPGRFAVRLQPQRRHTLEDLRRAAKVGTLPGLIDVRSAAEYAGEISEYLPRRGHLPGAQLVPFAGLFEPDGRYVQRDRYLAMCPQSEQKEATVAYCEVGVRACLFAMLHEAYTDWVVGVYDGSFMEWALHPELAVEQSDRNI